MKKSEKISALVALVLITFTVGICVGQKMEQKPMPAGIWFHMVKSGTGSVRLSEVISTYDDIKSTDFDVKTINKFTDLK